MATALGRLLRWLLCGGGCCAAEAAELQRARCSTERGIFHFISPSFHRHFVINLRTCVNTGHLSVSFLLTLTFFFPRNWPAVNNHRLVLGRWFPITLRGTLQSKVDKTFGGTPDVEMCSDRGRDLNHARARLPTAGMVVGVEKKNTPPHTHPRTHPRTHAPTHARPPARTHTRTHARTHPHTHTPTHTHTHPHTHTDTHTVQLEQNFVRHDSGDQYMPLTLQLDPQMIHHDEVSLTVSIRSWSTELGMQAGLTDPSDLLLLHIDRLVQTPTGTLTKCQAAITFGWEVQMPVLRTHHCEWELYTIVACIAHQGDAQHGHYQCMLRTYPEVSDLAAPAVWMSCDDGRAPQKCLTLPEHFAKRDSHVCGFADRPL